jgi:3-oxoacyl-[acyl-carrier protein] reductase
VLDLVIITGAGHGLGASIASDPCSYARAIVAIGSSSAVEMMPVMAGTDIRRLRIDLADPAVAEERVRNELERIVPRQRIGLVLCAAQIGSYGGLDAADFAEWSRVYVINVLGNLAVVKTCLPAVEAGGSLRAVFFGGGGAADGYPEFSGYAASKAATVRAVENLALEFKAKRLDAAAVVLAPGAIETNMLATVIAHGGAVRTKTDISEPTAFTRRFLNDEIDTRGLNGRFVHVRDAVQGRDFTSAPETLCKLRRVE